MRKVTFEELSKAFDRQEIRIRQLEKMNSVLKQQVSELESVVLKARNALTPRGMVKLSSEQGNETTPKNED